jgi:hypothetical protein
LTHALKKRLNSLVRIGELQTALHALKRFRLSALASPRVGLDGDLKAIFAALDEAPLTYGAQARFGRRHIRALQLELDSLAREEEAASRAAAAQATRSKLAEKAIESAAEAYRRHIERKELAEIIERALARRGASST